MCPHTVKKKLKFFLNIQSLYLVHPIKTGLTATYLYQAFANLLCQVTVVLDFTMEF